ncbi:hypothetical protein ABZ016_12930 [Streptomyces sp. NPDC006372]|uniref:hypothetical protein n=1 Tax=Streptomyces sp. NPDC006372 TaxID=3155599 RepID=UPI0033B3FDFB
MMRGRLVIAFLALSGVLVLLISCGNTGGNAKAPASTITRTETATKKATETATETAIPDEETTSSPSPSFSTIDDFYWTVRNDVASAQDWDDQFISVEANDICDKYNNRGATWEELIAEWTDPDSYQLTEHEAEIWLTDALAACTLEEVATATP